MNKKILYRLGGLFLFVLLISVAVVYFTFDIRALSYLTMFKPTCILLALGSLAVGLMFDGMRLVTLANVADSKLSYKNVVNVVLSNYFLALVTPGASGGAIAQVMFMRKAGVPVAKATAVVLVRTVMSICFLIFLVPAVLYTDPDIANWMPPVVLAIVSTGFVSLPILVGYLMHTVYPERIIYMVTARCQHKTRRHAFKWYAEFKAASMVMGKHPVMMLKAFLESGLSLLFIYGTVPAFFTGLSFDFDLQTVMGRMVLLNLVLYFSPTPGGSGIAEAGFVVLFQNICPIGVEGIMAVLWRFAAEYLPFMLGAVVTIKAFGAGVLHMASIGSKENKHEIH